MCCPIACVIETLIVWCFLYNELNRIKPFIPEFIINNQTGFPKGRFIGENTGLTHNNIDCASEKIQAYCFLKILRKPMTHLNGHLLVLMAISGTEFDSEFHCLFWFLLNRFLLLFHSF